MIYGRQEDFEAHRRCLILCILEIPLFTRLIFSYRKMNLIHTSPCNRTIMTRYNTEKLEWYCILVTRHTRRLDDNGIACNIYMKMTAAVGGYDA